MKLNETSSIDTYLLEHKGMIHSANRIINKRIERDGSITRLQLVEALLRIPNVRKLFVSGNKPINTIRLRELLSTVARRGAFPGYRLLPGIGFRPINIEVITEVKDEIALQSKVVEATKSFTDYIGVDTILKVKNVKINSVRKFPLKRTRKLNISWNAFQHENKGKMSQPDMAAEWRESKQTSVLWS